MNLELVPHADGASRSTLSDSPATPRTPTVEPVGRETADPARKRSLNSAFGPSDPRQKRKVTRACDTCKAKKAKCSGTQPCDSCAKRGQQCLYEARYSRGKPPTPPTSGPLRTAHPASNYSGTIRFAQEPLQSPYHTQLAPSQDHRGPAQQTRPVQEGTLSSVNLTLLSSASRPDPQRDRELTVQPTRRVEQQPEVPSRASPELEVAGQYFDSTSGLSFLHRAWKRLSNQSSQVMSTLNTTEENQRLVSAGDKPFQDQGQVRLPNIIKSQDLMTLYFDMCIATYRLLHRPTVEGWLRIVVGNSEHGRPYWSGLSRPRAAIIFTVLAIATFHEEKAKGGGIASFSPVNAETPLRQCDELFCEASRLTDAETGFPRLESAQVRLIQVLYLLMSSRMNQAWYKFGHALQIISALGLHRREDKKRPSQQRRDYIEEQCSKRTFWVAYTLDKYLGVIFGRPRHYHDDDIDQDFPDSVNDEDMTPTGPVGERTDDCHIESLVFHARIAQIAEKISREVYSIKPIPDHERIAASHRLGRELREWKASLPPFLGAINPSSLISSFRRQATVLKLAYWHAVMLAHRPFLLKNLSNRDETRDMARECISECISAAQSVLETVDRMARDGRLFHAFWWTHYICFCALVVVYVWAIQQSNSKGDDDNYSKIFDLAERCLTHLAQATASDAPSRRYSIILQELRTEAKRKTTKRPPDSLLPIPNATELNGNRLPTIQSMTSPSQVWEPAFGSPLGTEIPTMADFLDDWHTTDWLELDSSAFAGFDHNPIASMADLG